MTTPFQSMLSAGDYNNQQLFPDHYLGSNIEGILARRSSHCRGRSYSKSSQAHQRE